MKKILTLFVLSLSLHALADSYSCQLVSARQNGTELVGQGSLNIVETQQNGLRNITVNGQVSVDYEFNMEYESEHCYKASFTNVTLTERPNYKPRVYTGYSKFEKFDATETSECDGGGMYGYLVIEKDMTKESFAAHYVFQAGDHIGGTIDFSCAKK